MRLPSIVSYHYVDNSYNITYIYNLNIYCKKNYVDFVYNFFLYSISGRLLSLSDNARIQNLKILFSDNFFYEKPRLILLLLINNMSNYMNKCVLL